MAGWLGGWVAGCYAGEGGREGEGDGREGGISWRVETTRGKVRGAVGSKETRACPCLPALNFITAQTHLPGSPACTCLQGLANIVWGLGKMGVRVTHEIRQMVEALSREMVAQLTDSRHKGARARTPPRAAHACPVKRGRPVWAALLLTGCSAVFS